jgi:hypothetical protein
MMERPKNIPEAIHSQLLYRLNSRPAGDARIRELENELREGLAQYHELLGDLEETVRSYMDAAKMAKVP